MYLYPKGKHLYVLLSLFRLIIEPYRQLHENTAQH